MSLLSVIVPCFNEEKALPFFYEEITKLTLPVEVELIFVDDGSHDGTLKVVQQYARADERVKYISFSRNFGKEAAIYAGLENARGDYAVIMDADLQDPPALFPEMLRVVMEEGYDSAATRRVTRKGEPPIRSMFARLFYKLMNCISKTDVVDGARDYRIMNRPFIDALLSMGEYNRFSKGLFGWVGFQTKWIEFENVERVAGETKWSFWKLVAYAVEGVVAFSTAPLVFSAIVGVLLALVAFLAIIFIVVRKLLFGDPVAGWASNVTISLFLGGIQLFFIGVLGEYLSKMYLEVKKRPIYIVRSSNMEKDGSVDTRIR